MHRKSFVIKFFIFIGFMLNFAFTESNSNILYQYGLLDDVLHGQYTAITTVGNIAKHADFGLGAGVGLGELIIIDGDFYLADPHGKLEKLSNNRPISFASASKFAANNKINFTINNIKNFRQFDEIIESKIPNKNLVYAIKVTGYFDVIHARSEDIDHVPYTPIVSWMKLHQHEFSCNNQDATLVIFKAPNNISDVAIAYHVHFVNKARTLGGHVFDFTSAKSLKVEMIPLDQVHLILRENYTAVIPPKDGLQKDDFLKVVESNSSQ